MQRDDGWPAGVSGIRHAKLADQDLLMKRQSRKHRHVPWGRSLKGPPPCAGRSVSKNRTAPATYRGSTQSAARCGSSRGKQNGPLDGPGDGRSAGRNYGQERAVGASPWQHQKITPKRPGLQPRTRAMHPPDCVGLFVEARGLDERAGITVTRGISVSWADPTAGTRAVHVRSAGRNTRSVRRFSRSGGGFGRVIRLSPRLAGGAIMQRLSDYVLIAEAADVLGVCRAGLKPWAKLFHNLRASRQTELENDFPSHVVCRMDRQLRADRPEAFPSSDRSPLRKSRRRGGRKNDAKNDAADRRSQWDSSQCLARRPASRFENQ